MTKKFARLNFARITAFINARTARSLLNLPRTLPPPARPAAVAAAAAAAADLFTHRADIRQRTKLQNKK